MTISVVGTVGVPACYGGFESLVDNLIDTKDKRYLVYCQSSVYTQKLEHYKAAQLKYLPLKANGVQSILYDALSILHSLIFTKNDLLVLGVSGAITLPVFKLFSRRKVVTNIDGLEWKRDKWGKFAKWFLKFSEAVAVKYSDSIVADNKAITDYVKTEYNVKAETIAYGGDHAIVSSGAYSRSDYFLALCRIEPENNIAMILEAFSKTGKNLKFVGNWNNSEFGRNLREQYSEFDNVELIDPIYELDKLFILRSECIGYIHGHSAGGTNPSLVEMMHFGVNTFCYDCSYNRESTSQQAHYFGDANSLVNLLNNEEGDNGCVMKEIASHRYTWDVIRKQYEDLF
ncbi:DUF1972 domain-containing protein [Pseudoalteromonas sp. SSDWG2]|uniref:DUF1972 domain-containing protein n=1 Tax=Pseudoalteromonas sp. SSDWG2 TaxID=3139391 RepID=UPI003BA877F2